MKKDPSVPLLDTRAWRYFLSFFRGDYIRLLLCSAMSVFQALLFLPVILLVRHIFDKVLPTGNIQKIAYIGILIFALNLTRAFIAVWVKSINLTIIHAAVHRIRNDLMEKLYRLSKEFYAIHDHKIIHARIVQDTERLSNMGNALMSNFLPSIFICSVLSLVLLIISWKLFLVLVLLFASLFVSNRYMGKRLQNHIYRFQRFFETFSKGVMFTLRFMDLTRIQTAVPLSMDEQSARIANLADSSRKMHFFYTLNNQLEAVMTGTASIVIIVVGGSAISMGSMTVGEFFSFYLAVGFLYGYLNTVTDSFMKILEGNQSLVTLKSLWESRELSPAFGTRELLFSGALTFDSVSFSYGEHQILDKLNFSVAPGQKLAIIGVNGSGKTTVLQLILGFYVPERGKLLADGIPYGELDIVCLRKSIGMVPQHPQLFNGTIRENIGYGGDSADHAQMKKAARLALVHDFIQGLPKGYDTDIGEEGVLLSGGERQRIAIARALFRHPNLLILDEPTNHLDSSTVMQLMENLDHLDEKPAVILVSHDNSVIRYADTVVTLERRTMSHTENL
ncbi:MAG: ABC transporter ATP-binding protein [Pseudomonadota bacterium]